VSRIAIIPARGGSKRIPKKNIRDFLGKPIIAYSIEAALESKLFTEVMVSTDDEAIAEIARQYGATVPFLRSSQNSGDLSTTVDVILEVIESYSKLNFEFEAGCCLYPTAPFCTSNLISRGYDLMLKSKSDTVFPVVAFDYPIQRSLQLNAEGKVEMVWPEFLLSRSQDLPKRYHDTGLFYWFCTEKIKSEQRLFGENSAGLVISELECHDIDTPEDWEMAEIKYRRLATKNL
jgi:pseudaminic acid cytidylyltransferase